MQRLSSDQIQNADLITNSLVVTTRDKQIAALTRHEGTASDIILSNRLVITTTHNGGEIIRLACFRREDLDSASRGDGESVRRRRNERRWSAVMTSGPAASLRGCRDCTSAAIVSLLYSILSYPSVVDARMYQSGDPLNDIENHDRLVSMTGYLHAINQVYEHSKLNTSNWFIFPASKPKPQRLRPPVDDSILQETIKVKRKRRKKKRNDNDADSRTDPEKQLIFEKLVSELEVALSTVHPSKKRYVPCSLVLLVEAPTLALQCLCCQILLVIAGRQTREEALEDSELAYKRRAMLACSGKAFPHPLGERLEQIAQARRQMIGERALERAKASSPEVPAASRAEVAAVVPARVEAVELGRAVAVVAPGGGGRGAMPTPLLSLAAAAAAAEAYFRVWPVGIFGKGAGFMPGGALPFTLLGVEACNVAKAGKGDLSCMDGRLGWALGMSTEDCLVSFAGVDCATFVADSGWSGAKHLLVGIEIQVVVDGVVFHKVDLLVVLDIVSDALFDVLDLVGIHAAVLHSAIRSALARFRLGFCDLNLSFQLFDHTFFGEGFCLHFLFDGLELFHLLWHALAATLVVNALECLHTFGHSFECLSQVNSCLSCLRIVSRTLSISCCSFRCAIAGYVTLVGELGGSVD
ncbi:hypothetical protein KCU65_g239, partial [Aureobasidium melanogenum]